MSILSSETIAWPASAIQEQFWLLNQIHPESPAYNIPLLFRIKGRLHRDYLEKSINEMIARHEIFRTWFTIENGSLYQKIEPEMVMALGSDFMGETSGMVLDDEIDRRVKEVVRRPFTLSELPLIRCRLFRLPDGEHLFVVVMHHIITDLRSKELFTEELSTLYDACVNHKPAILPPPQSQYSEFSRWQRDWLAREESGAMISFWKERLEGQAGLLDLPMDKKRPPLMSLRGEALSLHFDAQLTGELKRFSRENSVTLFLTLLTAYVVLLFRYSGQTRLTIGVPLTNRRKAEYKNTMGCFVNILPLGLAFSEDTGFLELLGKVRFAMLGAHRNQEAPFQLLAKTSATKNDPRYNPLFQAGFTFEPPATLKLAGLDVESVPLHSGGSRLDMFLTLWEADDGIWGHFEYNTDLFDEAMIRRVADNYRTLLREILLDSDRSISAIPVLSAHERKRVCVDWNGTETSPREVSLVHRLIETQVEKTPHGVAALFEGMSMGYQELNQRANQLAHYLVAGGVKRGDLIGIYMDRSLEMLVVLLGVMKAGAAYVPLDPAFPEERLLYMLSHARVSVLLTQESLRHALPESTARRIFIDSDRKRIDRESTENPALDLSPEHLVYVIYTSGSTGRPKGVKVHHGAVVNFLSSMAKRPGLNAEDVLLAVTTLSFDIAVLELFLPLIVGARIVIATHETASDGGLLLDAVTRHQVTVLQATPVTWRFLLAAGWQGGGDFKILCGGEVLPGDLASVLVEKSSSVWNMYGPTETTVWSTCSRLTTGRVPVSVGRPIDNTRIYILDKLMQPVPTGVAGALFIGGAGVTQGYLNQPELTEAMFVRDPFDGGLHAKMYNTGDIARYYGDGTIEVMGRADFQVKINGFRIETGEVETVLATHPLVTQAVVSVHEFEPGDARLIAYYTHNDGRKSLTVELRHYLAGKLPDYMIPSIFMPLAAVPLTPNGKVDRKGLPVPDTKRPELDQVYLPPRNELEVLLSEIWGQVLKLDAVGIHDSFFEVGGNSLLGVRVVGQVASVLNRAIPMVTLFQYPTIESFAAYLSGESAPNGVHESIQDRAKRKRTSFARRRNSS